VKIAKVYFSPAEEEKQELHDFPFDFYYMQGFFSDISGSETGGKRDMTSLVLLLK